MCRLVKFELALHGSAEIGDRGKGKTKHLLDGANEAVINSTGNIVYLDKNSSEIFNKDKIYELDNINVLHNKVVNVK